MTPRHEATSEIIARHGCKFRNFVGLYRLLVRVRRSLGADPCRRMGLIDACMQTPPRKAFEQVIVLGGFSVLRIVTPPLSAQDRSYVMVNLADSDRAGNLVGSG